MLRLKQRTTPLPLHGAVALLKRLRQIGRLGKGHLQLGVLVVDCLLGHLATTGLILAGPLSHGNLPPQAIHLGLEPTLVVGQLAALLVRLDQGLLRRHYLDGLRLKELYLGLKAALVTRQLLMQPVGLVKIPSGRGRLRSRLRRLDAKTAGVGNEPVVMMTGPEQPGPPRQHLGCKKKSSAEEKRQDLRFGPTTT